MVWIVSPSQASVNVFLAHKLDDRSKAAKVCPFKGNPQDICMSFQLVKGLSVGSLQLQFSSQAAEGSKIQTAPLRLLIANSVPEHYTVLISEKVLNACFHHILPYLTLHLQG